jgi:hypothetical protein
MVVVRKGITSDVESGAISKRLIAAALSATFALAIAALGCGSSHSDHSADDGGTQSTQQVDGGTQQVDGGVQVQVGPTITYDSGFAYVGALDAAPPTTLPPLPPLSNVVAALDDDSVSITFDPVDGALDYRVYPLPSAGDINVTPSGQVIVHNGIYRCAGNREAEEPIVDNAPGIQSDGIVTMVNQEMVGGYLRTLANATIGYVYTQPGPGLVPVYVLGQSSQYADDACYFARWRASRAKVYTTDASVRTQLLSNFARDDGIAFYVPSAANSTTVQIYADGQGSGSYQQFYLFPDGPEAAVHPDKQPAFFALASQASGTVPLMRVYYQNACGWSHDELAVGQERFNRIYHQGDTLPWWSLLWSGITGPTTLVVEALDTQCPYQGLPSAQSFPSLQDGNLHQPFVTVDDMRAASATTEAFINGQNGPAWDWSPYYYDLEQGFYDAGAGIDASVTLDGATPAQLLANTGAGLPLPKAIARSFVQVEVIPHASMDFLATFPPNATPETFTPVTAGPPTEGCSQDWRYQSATFYAHFICMDGGPTPGSGLFTFGPVMGELWTTMGDNGADTNGKLRLTSLQKATMSSSTFLHVTMEVDSYSTSRRYPQILISDQDNPVQYNLPNGHTLIIQTRGELATYYGDYPIDLQVQICNLRTWDVNNQCPLYDLYHVTDSSGNVLHLAPNDEVGEHASTDHRMLYDVFASSQRVYVFLDGAPYGCADLPAVGPPQAGPVTVTWGDVLYHSAVDDNYEFHHGHEQIETHRHFDNLGFSSGVLAPTWDETRFPCAAPISL